jgi:hypothetical protein
MSIRSRESASGSSTKIIYAQCAHERGGGGGKWGNRMHWKRHTGGKGVRTVVVVVTAVSGSGRVGAEGMGVHARYL